MPDITTDTLPVLYWHSVPTATSYTIQISDTADFSTVLFSVPVADTAYTPSAPLPKGNIYWRVKSNLVDIWSDADHFYIQSGDVPFLIRYNGRKVATAKPAFTWHPVATATSYRILIANNNAFTNAITVPMTDTTYIPQVGLAKGFWYWKVSCSINPENYSTCDSLEIDTTVGVIPGIVTSGVSNISLVPHKGGIKVRLPEGISGDVCLDIFDIKGRVVYTITQNSIVHKELVWEYKDTSGKNVSSGIYLIRVTYGNKTFSYKVPVSR